jgi:phenylacetate-CoA ligase
LQVEGALPHYQIILTRERGLDEMEVQVEVTSQFFTDTVGGLEQLQARLAKSIETATGLRPRVRLIQPRSIQRSEGKAKRVLDQRKM